MIGNKEHPTHRIFEQSYQFDQSKRTTSYHPSDTFVEMDSHYDFSGAGERFPCL